MINQTSIGATQPITLRMFIDLWEYVHIVSGMKSLATETLFMITIHSLMLLLVIQLYATKTTLQISLTTKCALVNWRPCSLTWNRRPACCTTQQSWPVLLRIWATVLVITSQLIGVKVLGLLSAESNTTVEGHSSWLGIITMALSQVLPTTIRKYCSKILISLQPTVDFLWCLLFGFIWLHSHLSLVCTTWSPNTGILILQTQLKVWRLDSDPLSISSMVVSVVTPALLQTIGKITMRTFWESLDWILNPMKTVLTKDISQVEETRLLVNIWIMSLSLVIARWYLTLLNGLFGMKMTTKIVSSISMVIKQTRIHLYF